MLNIEIIDLLLSPQKKSSSEKEITLEEIETFLCGECKATFVDENALSEHIKIHIEKKNNCKSFCGRTLMQGM